MVKLETAETLALQALAWLAADKDRLTQFVSVTGAGIDSLSNRAQDPDFLASVLDFLLADEALMMAFCDAEGLDYAVPSQARAALPGGEQVHWT